MEVSKFPKDLLPKVLENIVNELNEEVNYPKEFTTMSMLWALSVAIGNTYRVKRRNSYKVNLSLCVIFVAPSGSCKSHPIDWCVKPLYDIDHKNIVEYNKALENFNAYEKLSEDEKHNTEEVFEPTLKQIILQDVTPEACSQILLENPRGVGSHNDEVLEWFNNFNRYNSGGARQQKMKILDGRETVINRKGFRHSVAFPFESVIGTIQSELLPEITRGGKSSDGLQARFNFLMPQGLKKNDIPIDEEEETFDHLQLKWSKVIQEAYNFKLNFDENEVPLASLLPYAKESLKTLQEWEHQNTEKVNLCSTHTLRTVYNKLEITFHKLCGLFQLLEHICEDGSNESIQIVAITRAKKLIKYLEYNNVNVAMKGINEELEREIGSDYLKQVYSRLNEEFSHSEAYTLYNEIEALEEGLELANKKEKDKALMRAKKNTQNWLKKKMEKPKKYKLFTKNKHGVYVKLFPTYKYK